MELELLVAVIVTSNEPRDAIFAITVSGRAAGGTHGSIKPQSCLKSVSDPR